jgi:hypothetical protein
MSLFLGFDFVLAYEWNMKNDYYHEHCMKGKKE